MFINSLLVSLLAVSVKLKLLSVFCQVRRKGVPSSFSKSQHLNKDNENAQKVA